MLHKKVLTLAIPVLLCTFAACKKQDNQEVPKTLLTTADKLKTIEGKHILKGLIIKSVSDRQGMHAKADTTYVDNYEVNFSVSNNNDLTLTYNSGSYKIDSMDTDTKYPGSISLHYFDIGGGYRSVEMDYNTNTTKIEELEIKVFYQNYNEHTTTTTIVSSQ